jgi:fructokinase
MTAGPIVVAGEALFDLVLARDGSLAGHPGGGPYNVARTIARLGQSAAFLGRLSTDGCGRRLREELASDGVGLDAAVATDAPTTLALAELDGAGVARYRFYESGTSAPGLSAGEAGNALPPRFRSFYLGTLGLVFEPIGSTLEALVARVPDSTLVALDPNCRPSMIRDPAAFRGRLARLLARTDVVKVSEEDLAWIAPGADPADAARGLLGQGHAVALLTLGPDGALVVTADATVAVTAPAVHVIDTIGAGDAFMGAFLARWAERGLEREDLGRLDEVARAAEFACRVAAITCGRAGADPPRLAELVTSVSRTSPASG